jgi:starvation-inducible outer membrane lipoprotein
MSEEKRSGLSSNTGKMDSGVIMAKVVGYLDPTFMGGLEVTLLRDRNNTVGDTHQTYSVKYASPFYGITGFEYMGLNKDDVSDTQKSYGMWFPTPEIGTTVLVVFADGDPAEGYYIGCIPSRFSNQMIPGIAASTAVEWAEGAKDKYDVNSVPVAEVNRKTFEQDQGLDFNKVKKPVHPFADRLLEEGLLEDSIRGTNESTGRRNVPNSVFGISTPGPFDRTEGSKKGFIGKRQARTTSPVPVSRLGGSQFVFDDGHDRFQRKTKPSDGPPEYADLLNNEKGEPSIPKDEFIRLRTRTGHQILLHNSEDLVYIANSRGTSWIELSSDGKIDIYAEDSVSIHTQNDFNFRADRDVNIEAGRNINMRTAGGRLHADVNGNLEFVVSGTSFITTNGNCEINSVGGNNFTAGGSTNILSGGNHTETASRIDMNGPGASSAAKASNLSLHSNPRTKSSAAWNGKNRYKDGELQSIMKRIPMHEPWINHENLNPTSVKPNGTDRG